MPIVVQKAHTTYLPRHEADSLDDGGLDDLLAWEHAPSDCIGSLRVGVGAQVAAAVDHVVRDVDVALNVRDEELQQLRGDEELKVCLRRNVFMAL